MFAVAMVGIVVLFALAVVGTGAIAMVADEWFEKFDAERPVFVQRHAR
jgi:hypothetical protein